MGVKFKRPSQSRESRQNLFCSDLQRKPLNYPLRVNVRSKKEQRMSFYKGGDFTGFTVKKRQ